MMFGYYRVDINFDVVPLFRKRACFSASRIWHYTLHERNAAIRRLCLWV